MSDRVSYSPPGATRMLVQFGVGKRIFFWGFRAVAHLRGLGWPTIEQVQKVYGHFGVTDIVPSLDAVIQAFACTAHTPVELHCPGCPHLSASEYHFLYAVSAAQSSSLDVARCEFERWLPTRAADWALGPACDPGMRFGTFGLTLSQRDVWQVELGDTVVIRNWRVEADTLH